MSLFGTSGIRGKVEENITPELAQKIGIAIGNYVNNLVCVGRDTRSSGEMLSKALISGINSSGVDVINLGIVPTPIIGFSTRKSESEMGIIITASHNPAQYNGIKIWNSDGSALNRKQEKELEKIIEDYNLSNWKNIGNVSKRSYTRDYIDSVVKEIDLNNNYDVVIDSGNATGFISSYVHRELGNHVLTLNSDPAKEFSRGLEPNENNLTELSNVVKETDADIGIAHDGDSDRIGVIDSDGEFVQYDVLLALISNYVSNKEVVSTVDASMILDQYLDVPVFRTKVGDVAVAHSIKERTADFGGEPSGTWIFPEWQLTPDGIYAGAKVVEMIDKLLDLSVLKEKVPEFFTVRKKIECPNEKKAEVQKEIESLVLERFNFDDLVTVDGVRVESEDFWVLFRPSGTEPYFRITLESESKDKVDEIKRKSEEVVKDALKSIK